MQIPKDVSDYHKDLAKDDRDICLALFAIIDENLSKAEVKVWHGHPVWFLEGNPIVGYSKQKAGVQLLFWSGQSFAEDELLAIGKFKAACLTFQNKDEVKKTKMKRWIQRSKKIQWDYKNIVKKKKLLKLTDF
jgi:hypothetical protein